MSESRQTLLYSPLLPVAIAFAAGIIGFIWFVSWWLPIAALVISLILTALRRNYAAILTVTFLLGWLVSFFHAPEVPAESVFDRKLVLSGVVETAKEGEVSNNLVVKVDSVNHQKVRNFRISVNSWSFFPAISETDRITFTTTLRPLKSQVDLPYEFDYAAVLRRNGIVATAFIEREDVAEISPAPGLFNDIRRMRLDVIDLIYDSGCNDFTKELLAAMLAGEREQLPAEARDLFSRAGLAHVLALSGLHVAIISMIVSLMLSPLLVFGLRRTRMFAVIIFLWIFAVMTGLSPSVVRAVVMATVFMLTFFLERRPAPLNSLSFAALIILFFDPMSILSVGFQLSFLAVFSIILLAEKLNPFSRRQYWRHKAAGLVTVSFAAMLATGVVASYYFHIFPVYFLLVNIPASLLLPFIICGGVILLLCETLAIPAGLLEKSLDILCGLIRSANELTASLPGATATGVFLSPVDLATMALFFGLLTLWLYRPGRWKLAGVLSVIALMFIMPFAMPDDEKFHAAYIPRHSRSTSVIVPDVHEMKVFTTAPVPDHAQLRDRCLKRYGVFMQRLGLDTVNIIPSGGKRLKINRTTLLLVSTNAVPDVKDSVDIAIICRGFTGDVVRAARRLPYRRLVVSSDIHPVRRARYLRELDEAGIKAVSLSDAPLTID